MKKHVEYEEEMVLVISEPSEYYKNTEIPDELLARYEKARKEMSEIETEIRACIVNQKFGYDY